MENDLLRETDDVIDVHASQHESRPLLFVTFDVMILDVRQGFISISRETFPSLPVLISTAFIKKMGT